MKDVMIDALTKEECLRIADQYCKLAEKAYETYQETEDSNDAYAADHFWNVAAYYKKEAEIKSTTYYKK